MKRLLLLVALLLGFAVTCHAQGSPQPVAFGGDVTNFWWNSTTHTLGIGPSTAAHFEFSPAGISCFDSTGTTPCVPSLQGSDAANSSSPVAGANSLGWNIGTDHLGHFGDNGEDYGPSTIVNRNWHGAANAYTSDSLVVLGTYDTFCGLPPANNTGGSTMAVNGGSALSITKFNGTALAAGDIVTTVPACILYTGAAFSLLNPQTTNALQQVASVNTYTSVTPTATEFMPLQGTVGGLIGTRANSQVAVAPRVLTISNLRVVLGVAETASATLQFTLMDGATGEAVTCTVGNSASTCSDLTHTFTAAAGDGLSWQLVQTGSGTSQFIGISFIIQ